MEGKQVVAIDKPKPAAPPTDLMAALKQSLAQMEGKKKGPQRVEAAQRESEVEVKAKQKSVAGKKKPPKRAA
jgi:non-homologous end joining protein Ku